MGSAGMEIYQIRIILNYAVFDLRWRFCTSVARQIFECVNIFIKYEQFSFRILFMQSNSSALASSDLSLEAQPPLPNGGGSVPSLGPLRISSQALFSGATEIEIEHKGALYRLRQTSLGKLILTK
jgi:hypothetical protein